MATTKYQRIRVAVLVVVVGCCVAAPCAAGDIYVTITGDTNDGFCGGPLNFPCSLRDAVIFANNRAGWDRIYLPPGVFTLTIEGRYESFAETGDLDIWEQVKFIGSGAGVTIIDGGGHDRVFEGHHGDYVQFFELTIRNGDSGSEYGAAFSNYGIDSILFGRCRIEDNVAHQGRGAGIFNTHGHVQILDSTLQRNSAECSAAISSTTGSSLEIHRSAITNNSTWGFPPDYDCWCGALLIGGQGAEIFNSTISGNECGSNSGDPSGVVVLQSAPVTLDSCTLADNHGSDIFNTTDNPGSIVLRNTVIGGTCFGANFSSQGGNVEGPSNTCGLSSPGDYDQVPIYLHPLGDHGGPTPTMPLIYVENNGNVAIDNNSAQANCQGQDQRGFVRPIDANGDGVAICDSGATEVRYSVLPFSDGFESGNTIEWWDVGP